MKLWWIISLSIGIALVCISFIIYGYNPTWELWDVPAYKSPFLDFQLITGSAESLEKGYDPAVENPYDPGQRIFNYPQIWYLFLKLGIGKGGTIPLAVVSLVLFFIMLALLPQYLDRLTIALLILLTFSPALMLAYERANVDILFFSAVALAILLLEVSRPASVIVILVGILFKIFPVFAAGIYLDKNRNQGLKYIATCLGFTALYFVITWTDMVRIFTTTQKGYDISYGLSVIPLFVETILQKDAHLLQLQLYVLAAGILLVALYFGLKHSGCLPEVELRDQRAFWAGAGIFIGTFLLGNNWDYRFMFTLLTIPALGSWIRTEKSFMPRLTLIALIWSCWYLAIQKLLNFTHTDFAFWLDETANWILFAGLTYLFIVSLPKWLPDMLHELWQKLPPAKWIHSKDIHD